MSDTKDQKATTRRRDFLKVGAAATAGVLAHGAIEPRSEAGPTPEPAAPPTTMPTRNLGRTGHRIGIFSLGGQAAIEQPDNEAEAVPIIERALDLGINYIDTSARYGGVEERWSERYIGQVLKRRRSEVFLATKTHDRTRDGSLRLLERSLELLQTDRIDLWQIHNLARMSQVEEIFAPDGAVKAMEEARDQGIVRFLGITGHADPDVLIAAMERFGFDTILMALNAADRHNLSFQERLLGMAVERDMGIIGMKIPARGRILSSWTPPPDARQRPRMRTPGPGTIDMSEAMRYVLSLPVSTVIIGCDSVAQLEENVEIARTFTPLSDQKLAQLEEKTEPIKQQALFFRRRRA
jgi:aryl-alcohol dehydrogenase-like predicted oxidoreductase